MTLPISANLGFLWTELPLPEAIAAAARAGFDAIECHWPYAVDPAAVRAALAAAGLPMLALNTRRGGEGEFGLAALSGREREARAAIDEAFAYGAAVGAGFVHVMAGRGGDDATFRANLAHAADLASAHAMAVLIEPLNARDAPGYHLATLERAVDVVTRLGRPEVRIMFDAYHLQIMGGDLIRRFEAHRALIGHVQIAAVPSRAEPDEGEVHYGNLLGALAAAGYRGHVGAEYRPRTTTEAGLGWLAALRAAQG
jgi:hydroxypyruvate isomerase